ncbi:hypothetical protein [Massilia sp. BSC265]|uniref:hypothetical protein n=1 Tax=Massilia sp. BSC265 TaxID=1549812 RepID=UPI0004E89D89|nr:hypothetical protein [Massilia sp. BSC265]KFI09013.1 hypothetical protein JN27_00715 [Massilia sp. BSC265]
MLTLNTRIDDACQVHGTLVLPCERRERCHNALVLALGAAVDEELASFEPEADPCTGARAGASQRPAPLLQESRRSANVDGA